MEEEEEKGGWMDEWMDGDESEGEECYSCNLSSWGGVC